MCKTPVDIELAVTVEPAPQKFYRTKIVKIEPRFFLVNRSNVLLLFCLSDCDNNTA